MLPNIKSPKVLDEMIESLDGLLLTGGGDMHPSNYGHAANEKLKETTDARDRFELHAINSILRTRKPILGICRGHQVLNIALGGTLYQDLSNIPGPIIPHADPDQTGSIFHRVNLKEDSKLRQILGAQSIETNSSHHQVVDKLGQGLRAVAFAPDGVCEAIESTEHDFVIGVQWHPEAIIDRDHSRKLFEALVLRASGQT